MAEAASPTSEQAAAPGKDAAAPAGSGVTPEQGKLEVPCRGGYVLTVEAADPVSVSQTQVGGTDCRLLCIPARKAEADGAVAWVRLRLSRTASANGGPPK